MTEKLISSAVFWFSFAYTIGPFWLAVMRRASEGEIAKFYKHYIPYLLFSWLIEITLIVWTVNYFGGLHTTLITAMHFIGAALILRMALSIFTNKGNKEIRVRFNFWDMTLLSLSNPKIWSSVPAGALIATYTDSLLLNGVIFWAISLPLFLSSSIIWVALGKQGVRILGDKLQIINSTLMAGFALYLLYKGILLL